MEKININEKTEGQRIDKFLKRYLPNAGTGFLYRMLREKKIKVNGKKADGNYLLRYGDEINIFFADDTLKKFKGVPESGLQNHTFSKPKALYGGFEFKDLIIFENEEVLIINKPAGMLSQKAGKTDISVCEYLVDYMMQNGAADTDSLRIYKPSAVNRLDRNTSGLLVCAKTLPAAQQLSKMFKDRSLKKEYLALVYGIVEEKQCVSAYLKKINSSSNKVEISDHKTDDAQKIETVYEPLAYMDNATLLNVDLITGKTHQIRAHLCFEGHAIIGDKKYFSHESKKAGRELKRQFLHAYKLTFPKCDGVLAALSEKCFTAELSEDLKKTVRGSLKFIDIQSEYFADL